MAKRIYKAKEPITLRQKSLSNGNKSLYLDIYQNGQRSYEFLKLYLIPEHTTEDAQRNRETMRLATAVKAKRIALLQDGAFDFKPTFKGKILLSEFLDLERKRYLKRGDNNSQYRHTKQVKGLIVAFGDRPLNKVTKEYLINFAEFLKGSVSKYGTYLSENTQYCYYNIISTALNQAVKDGYIQENPSKSVDSLLKPRIQPSKRVFLSIEELRLLKDTEPRDRSIEGVELYSQVQNAFLFSCYTGLRFSDIVSLRWVDIQTLPDGSKQVAKTMQKTKEDVYLPLSASALEYLPVKSKSTPKTALIFNLSSPSKVWETLQDWATRAGLQKHISFHTARHTFATLELFYGARVDTIQKLLGHKNINTTQIYAKVVEESKRKAVNLIPKL